MGHRSSGRDHDSISIHDGPDHLSVPVSYPADGAQTSRDARLISVSPIAGLLVEAIAEDLLNGYVLTTLDPLLYQRLPGVLVITLLLLVRGRCT